MRQTDNYPSLFDSVPVTETAVHAVQDLEKPIAEKTPNAESKYETEDRHRKELCKKFEALNYMVRGNLSDVFDHFLEFTINGWLVNGQGIDGWRYNEEETQAFHSFYNEWIRAMGDILKVKPWHDFLGYMYEMLVAGLRRKQGNGQFFTPMHVCDLMANVLCPAEESAQEKAIDPCCGSGRLMLAAHAVNPEAIVDAKDLDRTCCMMTVCNFLIHGCRGTVSWGNSLDPTDIRETWAVNPFLGDPSTPLGLVPHIIHNPHLQQKEAC